MGRNAGSFSGARFSPTTLRQRAPQNGGSQQHHDQDLEGAQHVIFRERSPREIRGVGDG